jgi:Fe-S cluster biogenesis protein NfuA
MSERLKIRAERPAGDPDTLRFVLEREVQPGAEFSGAEPGAAPLPRALLAIEGVHALHVAGRVVTVTRTPGTDREALKAPVAAAIRAVLAETDAPLGDGAAAAAPGARDDAGVREAVQHVLDAQANPSIAAHGGHVAVVDVQDGVVSLRMSGGCQGCAASAATLRQGVEQMIRMAVPEVREIVDVTDHSAGTNPYYAQAPAAPEGATPLLHRPVPPGAITEEQGRFMVAPDYLAPKLGLTADALREALRAGDAAATVEEGQGPDAGMTRITVRHGERAWAAEIAPDGAAREVPPPRRATDDEAALRQKIRAQLAGLAPGELPITYGALARALGMYMPGAVRRVTRALEATMAEDAAAGRPFLAALVVSRMRGRTPGQGFFDEAARLGRGPAGGEDEAAWWAREMAAARDTYLARVDAG